MGSKLSSWQDVIQRLFFLAFFLAQAHALSQEYCSSQNTGAGNFQDTYTFQSNGHCYNECEKYAFAIVQGKNCWCSNYAPSAQEDVSKCDTTCPGYGYESCGNSDDNLYGYIRADAPISGTVAASTAAKTSAEPSSTQTSESTKSSPSAAATTESSESSSSESTLSTSIKSSSAITQVTVVTQGGNVITQTVTSVPGANDTSTGSGSSTKASVSGGQIAGAVIGGLAGIALIVGIATWFLLRHRRNAQAGSEEDADGNHPPQRNVSTLSRTGLLKSAEKDYSATLPPINTRNSSNDPSDSMTPISERRNSRPLFHDQRLNPFPFMENDNGSHASIISIEDNRDYTRTLNVRNPDPPGRDSASKRDSWER
ncbi:hypothetical protein IWZ01DRAFT_264749 [Phyllosticta capitalensis]